VILFGKDIFVRNAPYNDYVINNLKEIKKTTNSSIVNPTISLAEQKEALKKAKN